MKTSFLGMFLALGAAFVSSNVLCAQTYKLTADIPFAFRVNDQVQPAGKYMIANDGRPVPLLMRMTDMRKQFIVGATTAVESTQAQRGKLVFHCYGGSTCFLAEIRPFSGVGRSIPATRKEKEILKERAPEPVANLWIGVHRAD